MPIASGSRPHGDGRNESRGFDYDFLHGPERPAICAEKRPAISIWALAR